MTRLSGVAAALLLASVCAASAQDVRGKVRDAVSGRPVSGALVSALGAGDVILASAVSDSAGGFQLQAGWPAFIRLRVERLAYQRLESVPLTTGGAEPLLLELTLLPQPIELPGLLAAAGRGRGNLSGFLRRREVRTFGQFLGPAEIAALRPTAGDHLLSLFVGIERDITAPGILGRAAFAIVPGMSGTTSAAVPEARRRGCRPWVYIDGKPMEPWRVGYGWSAPDEPTSIDFHIPVESIRGIEVYRSWYDAPAQFVKGTNRDCAIVLVWTDYGFGFRGMVRPRGGT